MKKSNRFTVTNAKAFLEIVSDHPTMKPIPFLEGMWQVAAAHWRKFYLQNIPFFFFPPGEGKLCSFWFLHLGICLQRAQRGWKRWNFPIHGTKWNGATNNSCRPSKVKEEENKIKESHYWNFEELLSSTNRYTHWHNTVVLNCDCEILFDTKGCWLNLCCAIMERLLSSEDLWEEGAALMLLLSTR